MPSLPAQDQKLRRDAEAIFRRIGVSRVVIVDDQYADEHQTVEDLIGLCSELGSAMAASLPNLGTVDFGADQGIWSQQVRDAWEGLNAEQKSEVNAAARGLRLITSGQLLFDDDRSKTQPLDTDERAIGGTAEKREQTSFGEPPGRPDVDAARDAQAAKALEDLLSGLTDFRFERLSLAEWTSHESELLLDPDAETTVFLFDRDFAREGGSKDEGIGLVRKAQKQSVGFVGLITHTVTLGQEYEAWDEIAEEENLDRDRFVVVAKGLLTAQPPDYYGFLGAIRLAALSARCGELRRAAWEIYEQSLTGAKAALERFSVHDFDQIVLASSREEGVWEPETLFRVFGTLLRDQAQRLLYGSANADMSTMAARARGVSQIPRQVAGAIGAIRPMREALRILRLETYESAEILNPFCLPLDLGDIFECTSGRQFILLTQSCDLMVRSKGARSHDNNLGLSGILVELVPKPPDETKPRFSPLHYFDGETGAPAYADFAKVHQVPMVLLDLCALHEAGTAEIEVGGSCAETVIDSWRARHALLQKYYSSKLASYKALEGLGAGEDLIHLALPAPAPTFKPASVVGEVIRYDIRRIRRLKQPQSGALLTAFAQFRARAAFDHSLGFRVPPTDDGTDDSTGSASNGAGD